MKTTKLEKFLINRGLLEKFESNLKKHYIHFKRLDSLLKNIDSKQLIFMSFTWALTSEGGEFWSDVDREWKQCLKNNKL